MWYEVDEGKHLSENRLEDIAGIKVETLATSCSYCMINFHSTKATVKETENLKLMTSPLSLLSRSLKTNSPTLSDLVGGGFSERIFI